MAENRKPAGGGTKSKAGTISSSAAAIIAVVCFIAGFFAHAVFGEWELGRPRQEIALGGQGSASSVQEAFPQDPSAGQSGTGETGTGGMSATIAALEENARENAADADAWTRLGNVYFDSDQYEKAIAAYTKSLAIDPDNPNVWTDMGIMYRRAGNPEKAIESFDKARSLDPSHMLSRYNKGIVLLHDLSDREGAVKAWEEVLEIDPRAIGPGGVTVQDLVNNLKK